MLKELIAAYQKESRASEKAIASIDRKVRILEGEADCLEAKAKELRYKAAKTKEETRTVKQVSWIDAVVRPLGEKLAEATGLQPVILGPAGICCRTFIELVKDPRVRTSEQFHRLLVVQPDFVDGELSLLYETGEHTDRFGPGTLGAVGGMNMVTKPLPDSLEEILPLLRDYQPAEMSK